MTPKIAVVGAGAPGLSSALSLLMHFPSVDVTVIADKFHMDTTSAGAAGIVSPYINIGPDVPRDRLRQWVNAGFEWYVPLAEGPESNGSGVMFTSGYDLFREEVQDIEISPSIQNFRKMTPKELARYPGEFKFGFFYTSVMVECRYYLPWLLDRIKKMGGKVIKKKIASFEELAQDYDVIVNCAGLSNRQLLNDTSVKAVRGQVLRMKIPWVKHFVYDRDRNYHLLVGRDHAIVGGTRQRDNYDTRVDPEDTIKILKEVGKLVPTLKDATIDEEWVGLRPERTVVRVEREVMNVGGKDIHLVHNYGHGARGVNLSWGTACEVVKLVGEVARQSRL